MPAEDVSQQPVARVYAEALLDLCVERGIVEDVQEDLSGLSGLMRSDASFHAFLQSVLVGKESRRESLNRMLAGRVSEVTLHFLQVLNEKGRTGILDAISQEFAALQENRLDRLRVQVESAVDLTDEQKDLVSDYVSRSTGKTAVLETAVTPNLLGGLRIRIGDQLIDGSVHRRLHNFSATLKLRGAGEVIGADQTVDE
jgi:F-type H+-transporting ATPase subunit delta